MINRQMARAYLMASDPEAMTRTWQFVMDEKIKTVTGGTRERWLTAIRDRAFNLIRKSTLVETRPEDFKAVLEAGRVATNVFLRKLHNFALDMNWLLGPALPKAQWPQVKYPPKRAITEDEHRRICEREQNPERRAFFQVLWHTGASQTDAAFMEASNVDLGDKLLTYRRKKTSEPAQIEIGPELEAILRTLPASGPLFPYLRRVRANDRATEFRQRCDGLGIKGATLHSYRYAWAQRAKSMGYPERYAQQALGHASKAMTRAYAKDGGVRLPSLETWERQMKAKIVNMAFGTSPGLPQGEASAESGPVVAVNEK